MPVITDELKLKLLLEPELDVYNESDDEWKRKMLKVLDMEGVTGIILYRRLSVSMLRLLVRAMEHGKEHLPDETKPALDMLLLGLYEQMAEAVVAISEGNVCPGCHMIHQDDESDEEEEESHLVH